VHLIEGAKSSDESGFLFIADSNAIIKLHHVSILNLIQPLSKARRFGGHTFAPFLSSLTSSQQNPQILLLPV
jgi:hypothetical protein